MKPMNDEQRFTEAPEATESTINDYGVIGDCRTAALVSRSGSIDWWCLPHFSGPGFFAGILDRQRGGRFSVAPADQSQGSQHYIAQSNVLQTVWPAAGAQLRLTDAMVIPDASKAGRLLAQRELLRSIEAVDGPVEIDIYYAPRPDFGSADIKLKRLGAYSWGCSYRDHFLLLHTDLELELADDARAVCGRVRLDPNEPRYLSVTYVRNDMAVILPLGESARKRMDATVAWWQAWSRHCSYEGPYRSAVMRSLLTIKMLSYSLSGAIVAAPTSSLPEVVGGTRNWDYRYCWLRDSAMTLEALLAMGYDAEARTFLAWLLHATQRTRPRLQVLYDVYGHGNIREKVLDHLHGYQGSRPVRIGNGAWDQKQLDVYGSVAMAALRYVEGGGHLSRAGRRMLRGLGKTVCRQWQEPDRGIWEIRGGSHQHTYSKVACWVTLDCLLKLADQEHVSVPVEKFRRTRDEIADAIEQQGFNRETNSYTAVFGEDIPDASLLLLTYYGYCDADDPRMVSTFEYLERHLSHGALMHRYTLDYDGFDEGENAFGICSFWAVEYLALAGRLDEAIERFEALLGYANHLGLFAEEVDVSSGVLLGNFPQAYTHVGLINAALAIDRASAEKISSQESGVRSKE